MNIKSLAAALLSYWGQPLALLLMCLALLGGISAAPEVAADAVSPQADFPRPPNSVSIETRPSIPWVKPGEEVTYEIYAVPGEGSAVAAEIKLSYGSDLELVSVEPGPFLGPQTIPGPAIIDTENRTSTHVWARVGSSSLRPAPGVLAHVTFRANEERPWNNWVRQEVVLVDTNLKDIQRSSTSFQVHVYERLPVPRGLTPGTSLGTHDAETGQRPVFRVTTFSPANLLYRIEVSRDGFKSIAHTFDQSASQSGWDRQKYLGGQEAEFVSPQVFESGSYQWRAYAWIEEIAQWTESSEVQAFEVVNQAIGISQVTPRAISRFEDGGSKVVIEGWGFRPGTTATLWPFRGSKTSLTVERFSDGKLSVTVPQGLEPGLASLQVTGRGDSVTGPLLIMPPGLYTTTVNLFPSSREVVPGSSFYATTRFDNWGTDENSVALVAVHLPDPVVFELLGIDAEDSVEVLDQDSEIVLLAVSGSTPADSKVTFEFRLTPGPAISQSSLVDFTFNPVVLGEVSVERWDEMRSSMALGSLVRAVEAESEQSLSAVAQTFNDVPQKDLETFLIPLLISDESHQVTHLITRMQGHGLDTSKVYSALNRMPEEAQTRIVEKHRYTAGVWP